MQALVLFFADHPDMLEVVESYRKATFEEGSSS
jgi:hypothetical protein